MLTGVSSFTNLGVTAGYGHNSYVAYEVKVVRALTVRQLAMLI